MLRIPRAIYEEMIAHSQADFPLEACGILGGSDGGVESIHPMTNTDQSNEHFMMEPQEQFAVIRELRGKGLGMVAIYHSHPETAARPSPEDIRLALTPDVSYLIVSLAGPAKPDVKSYRIAGGVVTPEDIEVVAELTAQV
jgi:[CysO sulfur-carrier protein]-S-L-cysteine hydrolase